MSQRSIALGAALFLLTALGVTFALLRRHPEPPTPAPAAVEPPERPRPAPPSLAAAFEELGELRRRGDFAALAGRYPPLLLELERAWGAGHRDLALYHYDLARALIHAGRPEEGHAEAARALERWPDCLALQNLCAFTRLEGAIRRGHFDAGADGLARSLLRKENQPRLLGLGVEPAALAARWAEMHFQVGRYREALEAAEAGLAADPRSLDCRAEKAQVLLELQRSREALGLLVPLTAERHTAPLERLLGIAHLKSGDPAAAWERFSRLLRQERTRDEPAILAGALLADLHLQAGRALNRLGRPREAAELLLERLMLDPEYDQPLHELAQAAQALGAGPGASALNRRLHQLLPRQAFLESALRERDSGPSPLLAFHQAQAALAVDRSGEALELLEDARRRFPKVAQLDLEVARVHSLLGRDDLAEQALSRGLRESASAVLLADLARLHALRGDVDGARRLLLDPRLEPPGAGKGGGERSGVGAFFTALRARVQLELGDTAAARACLDEGKPAAAGQSEEALLLARAEVAVLERRFDEARRLLEENYHTLPGGVAWARALSSCVALLEASDSAAAAALAEVDASDLLDHPRLFLSPALPGPWPARLRAGHARRRELLARLSAAAGRDAISLWEELIAQYLELKAARKAREAAWYLVSVFPNDREAYRRLAQALSAPEEVVVRAWALKSALRLAPLDEEMRSSLAEARQFLGLPAP